VKGQGAEAGEGLVGYALMKSIEWFLENQFLANQPVCGDIEKSEDHLSRNSSN